MRAETIIAEPLGLTLDWDDAGRLASLHLHWSDDAGFDRESADLSAYARELKTCLRRFVDGREPGWPELPAGSFEAAGLSEFAARVLSSLRADCGRGQVLTYGGLAALAGRPRAARAVGQIMAANPWPLLYPCHRVIGSGGKLTGFGGADGLPMKAWLLRREGLDCDDKRVRPPRD